MYFNLHAYSARSFIIICYAAPERQQSVEADYCLRSCLSVCLSVWLFVCALTGKQLLRNLCNLIGMYVTVLLEVTNSAPIDSKLDFYILTPVKLVRMTSFYCMIRVH